MSRTCYLICEKLNAPLLVIVELAAKKMINFIHGGISMCEGVVEDRDIIQRTMKYPRTGPYTSHPHFMVSTP